MLGRCFFCMTRPGPGRAGQALAAAHTHGTPLGVQHAQRGCEATPLISATTRSHRKLPMCHQRGCEATPNLCARAHCRGRPAVCASPSRHRLASRGAGVCVCIHTHAHTRTARVWFRTTSPLLDVGATTYRPIQSVINMGTYCGINQSPASHSHIWGRN